jgi:hypothetical protein
MAVHFGGFSSAAADNWAASRGLSRSPIAVAILGQSNERGQVDPTEAIGGVLSRVAYPQAFASLRNAGLRYPIGPAVAKYGSMWFKLYDDLYDWGYDAQIINAAKGSLSLLRHLVGQVQTRANTTAYYQARSPARGTLDRGYIGDIIVNNGRVFQCVVGRDSFAMFKGSRLDCLGAPEIDYIYNGNSGTTPAQTNATAASEPAGMATAAVGDVIVDGTVSWKCLSTSTTYLGATYAAGAAMLENQVGFDPFGLIADTLDRLLSVREARYRIACFANGQADTGADGTIYKNALNTLGTFFLKRGCVYMPGLSFWQPSQGTTNWNTLSTSVTNSVSDLKSLADANYTASQVQPGANLYSLLGTTGNMAADGAYFAKDSGKDNIHVNAVGAIAGGAAWANAVKAWLPQQNI